MDLIGPGPIDDHFVDAEQAVCDLNAQGDWVDLGSGAGFPAIAFAALNPRANILMVESRQKRAFFLRQVITRSQLSNITVFHGRSEHLNRQFDGVISRAYKKPLAYLEDAARLGKANAQCVLMLGDVSIFTPPSQWSVLSEKRYAVRDGYRRRLILSCAEE